jgi:2-methylcitrate dehydratase PrpD
MPERDTRGADGFEASLAEFVATTEFADLPDGVADTVRRAFVDTVGVTLAGLVAESGDAMRGAFGGEEEHANDGARSLPAAALEYGTAAHALDYDDLSWGMDGHPSVVLVPPILAIAEQQSVSGEAATTAYAVGYEVACAVAAPISPDHYEAGWHATATFGTFGATAAAASLLDLTVEQIETALNVAASMPAGTKRNFGSMTKPLHAGLASRSGVTAAALAAEGFDSGTGAIGGDGGFWDLYGSGATVDDADVEAVRGIGTGDWALDSHGVHTKRYPCCYFTHTAIAAVQRLAEEHDLTGDDVVHANVYASRGASDALAYDAPETELAAKFSMPHAVAVGLMRETVGLDAFEETTLQDEQIRSLYNRVTLHRDESLPYDAHAARVELDLGDRTVSTTQENPPWVHTEPPSEEGLREKFVACATRAVSEAEATSLYDRLSRLPDGDVSGLLP